MFVDPKTALLRWVEPAFFPFRVRSIRSWVVRLVFLGAVYLVCLGLMDNDRADPNFVATLMRTVAVPVLAAGFVLALIELPNVQRTITISKTGIDCGGGPLSFHLSLLAKALLTRQWNPREIREVQLLPPGDPANRWPCAVMLVTPKYSRSATIGISRKVTLLQVATALESLGVAVKCSKDS